MADVKKMKVALINPRGAERNNQNLILRDIQDDLSDDILLIGDDTEHVPHLGLLTIAGLFPAETRLFYIDEEYMSGENFKREVLSRDFDLALLSAYNPQAKRAYEIAGAFRKKGIMTAMGGLHASSVPQEAMPHVDTLFIGEGEDIFRQFLQDLSLGKPQPVYRSEAPPDLLHSPIPRFDIVKSFDMYNKVPLFATRGCPHRCSFCIFPRVYHSAFRHKSEKQLKAEVEMVKRLHRAPFISFSDENMLADHDFGIAAAKVMEEAQVPWECYCDISIADDQRLLNALAKSGCQLVQIGIETLNPENLKNVDPWKTARVAGYSDSIRKIQKMGIPVMAMFIAGFDSDGPEVFDQIKSFVMKNRIREIDFAVLTPMPGTPMFESLKAEGRILSEDWDRYTWTRVNFQPVRMSADTLEEGPLKLFKYFTEKAGQLAGAGGFTPKLPFHVKKH